MGFQHANDYWSKGGNIEATGAVDNCLNYFKDFFQTSEHYRGGVMREEYLTSDCENSTAPDPPCYEEHIFKEMAKEVIRRHALERNPKPMFLLYAAHLLHTPLQVPKSYQARIQALVKAQGGQPFDSHNRMLYAAMVLYLDDAVREMVNELKRYNMWDNTLMVFVADNGGPIYEPGSGNNHPLRGGKYSDYDGGVRTNAFVSGGYVPFRLRNTHYNKIISIADWYATFCVIGGGSTKFCTKDFKSEKANAEIIHSNSGLPLLPQVDSVPQWASIITGLSARKGKLHLSPQSVIDWPWKLITDMQNYSVWQGPLYPNCSTIASYDAQNGPNFNEFKMFGTFINPSQPQASVRFWQHNCTEGCLYNIAEDPTEHTDLAKDMPVRLRKMQAQLKLLNKGNFNPYRGEGRGKACHRSFNNGGYYGPFLYDDGFYTPPFVPSNFTPEQRAKVWAVNGPGGKMVQEGMIAVAPEFAKWAGRNVDQCLTCPTAEVLEVKVSGAFFFFKSGWYGVVGICVGVFVIVCGLGVAVRHRFQKVLPRSSSRRDLLGGAESQAEQATA